MTAGKTVPELTAETPPIVGTDEVVVYRSPGPLKRTTAATVRTYMQSNLGTMATQNAHAVTITGGSITGITDLYGNVFEWVDEDVTRPGEFEMKATGGASSRSYLASPNGCWDTLEGALDSIGFRCARKR